MFDRFTLADLNVRALGAPMAGGVSTPALAAAVTNGGGLGFLAAGMLSAEELADAIVAARQLTTGALGVNLFVPERSVATTEQLRAFAAALEQEAERYGVALGRPQYDEGGWSAQLDVVRDLRPEAVSFTFGTPDEAVYRQLSEVGVLTLATVTTVREATIALSFGADALVAQGPNAGGHRATFDARTVPPNDPLDDLVAALTACFDCPVVAAGGLGTSADVKRLCRVGAAAVQLGTAFLLADEAGTHPLHRAALGDRRFAETVLTRAFTGRYARVLRNRFADRYDADAVFGFPEVAMMTAPLQAAALKVGDPHGVALWAGAGFHNAKAAPAADIMRELAS